MLITADQGAPQGFGSACMVGTAKINEQTVSHDVRLASMSWPVRDGWSEIPSPRCGLLDVPVSVSGVEVAPITIAPRRKSIRSHRRTEAFRAAVASAPQRVFRVSDQLENIGQRL